MQTHDFMVVKACLRSGFCCRSAPCGYGVSLSDNNRQCSSLVEQEDGLTSCAKYNEISKDPASVFSPAFGAGCCMPMFNDARQKIKHDKFGGEEQYIKLTSIL